MAEKAEEATASAADDANEPPVAPAASPAATDEPEVAVTADAPADGPAAADSAAALVEKEVARAQAGGLVPAALPDGWATLDVKQRIQQHHPIVHVRQLPVVHVLVLTNPLPCQARVADNDVQFKVSKIKGDFVLFDGGAMAGSTLYSAFARVPKRYDNIGVLDGIAFPMSKVKIGTSHGIFTGVRENHAMKTTNALCYMPMLRAPRLEDTLSLNRLKPLTEEADAGEKQSAADAMDDYVNRCALRTCFLLRPCCARATPASLSV